MADSVLIDSNAATSAEAPSTAIKTMKLYNNIDRIQNELKHRGLIDKGQQVAATDLISFCCLNYTGREGCDRAMEFLQLSAQSNLLDVGCGVGGPSLYISHSTRSKITAVDMQEDIVQNMTYLSELCGLTTLISPICSNIADLHCEPNQYDGMISLLTILHIPVQERKLIFEKLFSMLKPGGKIYIEDYFKLGSSFPAHEMESLAQNVYCAELPSAAEYASLLEEVGFERVQLDDVTTEWKTFVADRYGQFLANKDRFVSVHNATTFDSLDVFYRAVDQLFKGGNLGGAVIYAHKPQGP